MPGQFVPSLTRDKSAFLKTISYARIGEKLSEGADQSMITSVPEMEVVTMEIWSGTSEVRTVIGLEKAPEPYTFLARTLKM